MSFVHLGVRTEYAIVDSIVKIKELVKRAVDDGQTALGIADFKNIFALVKFYKACIGAGIKPLLGTEVITGDDFSATAEHESFSVILYAMNNDGYQNILRLVSDSYTNRPMGENGKVTVSTPIVLKQDLFDPAKNAGIIAILTHRSEITSALRGGMNAISTWQQAFGDRLYLAVKRTHVHDDDLNRDIIMAGARFGVPIIAHNDVRFMNASVRSQGKEDTASTDFDAHEARVCIASGYVLADTTRPRIYSELQYFKTQSEMSALFADIPQVIENTALLASRCNVTLTLGKNFLPAFPIPEGMTEEEFFRKTSEDGLNRRLDKLYPPESRDESWADVRKPYDERLEFEVDIILKMGFPGYFLIVMDFIRWAKENGVPVGPGRGSGAGSLVAYSLNITDLDPLRYDLLFERFLNPERVSMPDFDVDFCIEGRDRVIAYVADTYGRMAVSQIITFGTMAARAVVRDVARVQGKSYGLADKISKLIPKTPGISLEDAVKEEPLLKDLLTNADTQDHEQAVEIWEMAQKLEGMTRNVGKHAGGVLIAPNRISDFSAIYADDEGHFVSQYDKDDVEAVGLVKFDFLGLRNLTVIKSAINNIDERLAREGKDPIDLDELPLDDTAVYEHVLQNGNTTAVFQLESSGMKKYLKQLKPSNIEDVIAMCALYRPGPLETGMVSDFIDRKHGIQEVAYPDPQYQHDWLKPALESTYGVIVYQEQVMQIAQTLAGYTLGGADMLRRAMGKKKPEEMAAQRSIFEEGAIGLGVDGKLAIKIFELVEKFAGYGFNKSHSAAYGVLAYQTAYLKHYYPAEFMAAVLTSEMDDTDTVVFLISDCKDNFDLEVLPPSVNHSQFHFVARDPKTIIYGLGAVKGVGEDAVASIVKARSEGAFKDLYDFCNRVDTKKVGKRALEALINAGCFDDLAGVLRPELLDIHGKNLSYQIRGGLWEQLPQAMEVAHQNRLNSEAGTFDLFAEVDEGLSVAPPLPDIIWGDQTRLRGEKDTLGLYLTGHPMDAYRDELPCYTNVKNLSEVSETGYGKFALVAGLVIDVANFGNRVAITLDDGSCRLELSCYMDKYQRISPLLESNISLNTVLSQKYAHLAKEDKNFNPKRLNMQTLAKIDKKDWEQLNNLNGVILIARISVSENDGRLFARLQGGKNIIESRIKSLDGLHVKLHSHDTERLSVLTSLLKENVPPNPDEIAGFIKSQTTTEDGGAIIDANGNTPDGCLPVSLYLYDECSICKVLTNDRFRLYPSDNNLNRLRHAFGSDLMVK
ncbi:DNA polymerase III subunit alpha [Moraxella bovis]|uniref:DNA polymerase III subunit alpha n=1 Tax=Moraxella bovis TaxID=476 RepID=A0AAQ2QBT8_MORBO|nr:DNA polymerase III subunit alpha [Moraxella bovis]OOR89662.1 DNA polymerase III subunit alpha [Moraxella bovis]UYZ76886.1 DNA polymerase III subunit alpha [Moraxella bovis]UYZ77164.1 DNA polymerase III subunit alpha [Moraxella bovis]UYZ82347.1 DNA polymerase III subunit alpha [Moraxella bovis]UYZ85644.1 DNA polymerase III subunit alpha [Moraxella bovis]